MPEPARHEGGTVTVGDWQLPGALLPVGTQTASATAVEQTIFSPLIGVDSQLAYYGDLARDVPSLDNGEVKLTGSGMDVAYTLREGLRWSDGQPVTPDDIAFTWSVQKQSAGYDQITGIDRSGSTATIHFKAIYPAFPLLFSAVLPAHRLASIDPAKLASNSFWNKPDVASGPFQVLEAPGSRWTLQRNPHYPDGRAGTPLGHAAHLDRLVFRGYDTKDAELADLKAGDLQVGLDLNERDLDLVSRFSGVRLKLVPSLSYEQLALNHDDPLFKTDPALAAALAGGLDRHSVTGGVLHGRAPLADGPISPLQSWIAQGPAWQTDPAAARQALDADGWSIGSDGIRAKAGRRLTLVISTAGGNPLRDAEAAALAAALHGLGAEARVQEVPNQQLFGSYASRGLLERGTYQLALWSWVLPPDPDALFDIYASTRVPSAGGSGQNYDRCRDPEIDAALAEGRSTLDAQKRGQAYSRFLAAYRGARCEVPLFQRLDVAVTANGLHNVAPNPAATGNTWNAVDWWV
ncbi:MAG TPA: peptide ABC transporter substrate-binding protein [Candidatus Dormibacteraeota bacterium]